MSNRHHLPAGHNIHAPGNMPMEMNGPAGGGGPRRRQHHHHHHHHQQYMPQYHQQANPMYQNYGQQHNPYAPQQQYFGMPPQFQNGGMPSPGYPPYQGYARSPPAMPQYVPMVGVSVPPSFSRHVQSSPSLSTPYQPPQPAAPPAPPAPQAPPHTPASSHSSQIQAPVLTPPTPQTNETITPPSVAQEHSAPPPSPPPVVERAPFRPPLPWHSCPAVEFPARTSPRRKSRQRQRDDQNTEAVLLPKDQQGTATASPAVEESESATPETAKQAQAADKIEETAAAPVQSSESENPTTEPTEPAPVVRAPPTSWAKLFAKTPVAAVVSINGENGTSDHTNGVAQDGPTAASSVLKANANSIAEAILSYKVGEAQQTSVFLEPRGLINTGNMCYMNSVLQVLMYCSPFYDFLAQISKRAAHSFNSETPLLDAMIMFMHEYKVLKSAPSNDQLRKVIRGDEIERYGEPFTPEFVYEAIRQLSRFASMRRGHQQDAEEFLGFLLQSLDDECTLVMNNASQTSSQTARSEAGSVDGSVDPSGDWLEVGRKRRAAVTRSWGSSTSTPITKIFGGLLRSEFRVPGLKDSITTEPYQPLQLDIGSPEVRNVVDALRGLTRPERLQGDFNSPRGKDITATKQVFIETLPPVLILHLKRFQFDAEGGTTKIWKNVGYPLDLEIPREVLARQARQTLSNGALPKYKLISVIYHHGKNASGGHYTADVRRQDGHEWLRLDDTVLRRLHSEQVAGGDSEEDTKDARKQNSQSGTSNRFGAMNDEDEGNDEGWNQVTASTGSNGKRWSSVVTAPTNGTSKDKYVKENIKDNKVAYILFYQRV